jgi:hypothetical protein
MTSSGCSRKETCLAGFLALSVSMEEVAPAVALRRTKHGLKATVKLESEAAEEVLASEALGRRLFFFLGPESFFAEAARALEKNRLIEEYLNNYYTDDYRVQSRVIA